MVNAAQPDDLQRLGVVRVMGFDAASDAALGTGCGLHDLFSFDSFVQDPLSAGLLWIAGNPCCPMSDSLWRSVALLCNGAVIGPNLFKLGCAPRRYFCLSDFLISDVMRFDPRALAFNANARAVRIKRPVPAAFIANRRHCHGTMNGISSVSRGTKSLAAWPFGDAAVEEGASSS